MKKTEGGSAKNIKKAGRGWWDEEEEKEEQEEEEEVAEKCGMIKEERGQQGIGVVF